jgi:DNA-binding response OmpR family regulator
METLGASILVVEDDETLAMGLTNALEHERFTVTHCDSGEAALEAVEDDVPDVLVLDVMLPGMDGLSVLKRVKAEHPEVKPFSLRELIARVKARLRARPAAPRAPELYRFGKNEVDLRRRILLREGEEHRMTTHESGVLAYLIANRGRDVSREDLLQHVWGYSPSMATRTVDNQILKLRKKVEETPSDPRHILTVHGTGYRFEE